MLQQRDPDPYCTTDRFAAKNGMKVVEVGEGYSRAEKVIEESDLNGIDIPMGGVYFTLADISFGAANNYIANGVVTLNCSIEFIASAKVGDTITAECRTVAKARKIVRNEVEIKDQDGKLLTLVRITGYRKETWN